MHLHHELQRALAQTKIDGTVPPVAARPEKQPRRVRGVADGRNIQALFGHRPTGRDGRTPETFCARQH